MSSGGGSQTTVQQQEPYKPAEPYLKDILAEAGQLYRSGTGRDYFPGSTVVPFAQQTQQALNLQQAAALEQAAPSALQGQAANVFSAYAGQPVSSYAALTPQSDYLSDVRQGITSDVMGNIATQFGGMGRTGTSPMAQQAAARGITQAYAPLAMQQASQERGREQQALESAYGRQLTAAGQLPGMQQAMDVRRMGGVQQLGQVGSAYEDLARRQLQDQIARFQYGQDAPMRQLQQYAGLISPIAAGLPTAVSTGPGQQSGGLGGAFGGAVAGSALTGMLGPAAPFIGAGLGGMGYI